jgi:ABC-2 type transport system permease protein
MLQDIRTVMWKERKGLFRYRGSRTRLLLTLLSPFILAIYMPLEAGRDWVDGAPSVLLSAIIPLILVGITVPDSFAGERERHTLGTLLASRLPDRAILFGKAAVSVGLAWGVTLLVLLLSLVTVNVAHGEGEILFYARTVALANVVLSFILATLFTGAGVLISLRAATVQEASQTLMAIFLVPPVLLSMGMLAFSDQVEDFLGKLNGEQLLLAFVLVLLVADVAVFAAALARFQRSRHYLD